jgi:hypothetical protein
MQMLGEGFPSRSGIWAGQQEIGAHAMPAHRDLTSPTLVNMKFVKKQARSRTHRQLFP